MPLHSTMLLLYLQQPGRLNVILKSFTFHYASTLSYCPEYRELCPSPFTFHYASTLSKRLLIRAILIFCIYIPLCFYFIPLPWTMQAWHCGFTFHYASTLSSFRVSVVAVAPHLHSTMLLLYRRLQELVLDLLPDLHSTMLLLYPIWLMIARTSRCTIYIPLCFYFIRSWVASIVSSPFQFTFHYASTLSLVLVEAELPEKNLHSTMLLLYRRTSPPLRSILPIYIPLCFYFIGFSPGSVYYYMHHLHSTMLLLYRRRHEEQSS